MTDKSQKVAKLLLVAGGAAIGVFLIAKYHKNLIQKFSRAKNRIIHDFVKIQCSKMRVEIINSAEECDRFIAELRK